MLVFYLVELLVNDQHFYLPVKDYRNGFRAIANGAQSPDSMELVNVTRTSDVRVGDLFVTSGFAYNSLWVIPLPVAIKRQPGRKFLQIDLVRWHTRSNHSCFYWLGRSRQHYVNPYWLK